MKWLVLLCLSAVGCQQEQATSFTLPEARHVANDSPARAAVSPEEFEAMETRVMRLEAEVDSLVEDVVRRDDLEQELRSLEEEIQLRHDFR